MIEEPKLEKPTNLEILFAKIVKKQNESKQHRLINFISRAMPGGVDAPIASMAEYETFKSDKSANFLSDGAGHVVFRQYRRARLSDVSSLRLQSDSEKDRIFGKEIVCVGMLNAQVIYHCYHFSIFSLVEMIVNTSVDDSWFFQMI